MNATSLFILFLIISTTFSCKNKKDVVEMIDEQIIENNIDKIQVDPNKVFCEENKDSFPYAGGDGSVSDPFIICSSSQFNQISTDLINHDKSFKMKTDIDFSNIPFEMISDSTSGFLGVFDGGGYSIKNVVLNYTGVDYVGIFKKIAVNGIVKNLTLENIDIIGGNYVGAIAGFSSGIVDNCKSSGTISGNNNTGGLVGRVWGSANANAQEGIFNSSSSATIVGNQWTGGVVGWSRNAIFEKIFFTGSITSGNRSGGLVGVADGSTDIIDSYSTGSVLSSGYLVGGIVGGINGNIINSFSTGSVTSSGGYVGGIAGTFKGLLSKSYSTSEVNLTGSYVAGGLVGYLYANSGIENSYFNGTINSSFDYVGGVVGYNEGSPITYSFSVSPSISGNDVGGIQGGTTLISSGSAFWDKDISSIFGDFIDDMVTKSPDQGLTTSEMKTASTFINAGYSSDIWDIKDGFYPILK